MTTRTLDALLAAVIADPADNDVRMVYADRLDEAGEAARAEFIRVGCELVTVQSQIDEFQKADIGFDYPERAEAGKRLIELRRRERELLDAGWFNWAPEPLLRMSGYCWPNCDGPHDWEFRRGFVEVVHCSKTDWLAHGKQIVRAAPVREVRLDAKPEASAQYRGWFRWWTHAESGNAAVIGEELYECLTISSDSISQSQPYYRTEADALAALSSAALRWARTP